MRFPKKAEALSDHKVVDVAIGSQHCLVLTSLGDVLGWGKNSNGEVDASANAIPIPSVISKASNKEPSTSRSRGDSETDDVHFE